MFDTFAVQAHELCNHQATMAQYDDNAMNDYNDQKELKRQTLLELVDFCDNIRNGFNDASIICDVLNMIACNIFRALPPMDANVDEEDEEDHFMEPAWPHLSVVYELLLRIVQSARLIRVENISIQGLLYVY